MDVAELAMMLNTIQLQPVDPKEFQQASLIAKEFMNKLDQEQQMFFYGLFKQATVGENTTEKPDQGNIVEYYKWLGWQQFTGFPREDAAKAYVYVVNQMKEDLLNPNGQGANEKSQLGPSMSMFSKTEEEKWADHQSIFEGVTNGDLDAVTKAVSSGADINLRDDNGLTPLHFAADRGNPEILSFLLEKGASINAVDNEGQTPLMLAVVCEHLNIVELLVAAGADQSIKNSFGESVQEFPDLSPEILAALTK